MTYYELFSYLDPVDLTTEFQLLLVGLLACNVPLTHAKFQGDDSKQYVYIISQAGTLQRLTTQASPLD